MSLSSGPFLPHPVRHQRAVFGAGGDERAGEEFGARSAAAGWVVACRRATGTIRWIYQEKTADPPDFFFNPKNNSQKITKEKNIFLA